MVSLFRSRAQRIGAVFVGVVMLGVGFLPLFGGPGYEQSLASGLVVPSAAAVTCAIELSAGEAVAPFDAVVRGAASGLLLAAVAFVTALLHGLRVGFCDLESGTVGFAMTALPGAILGGVWGALVSELARRTKRRRLVACACGIGLPLASALVSVARFYTSPMIFAFDPFAGYFSGVLYDTVIDAGRALETYRMGSALSLACVFLLASALKRTESGGLSWDRGAWGRTALGLLALAVSIAVTAEGPKLGHWQTTATIIDELGGQASGKRCDVVFPSSLLPAESALLVKDCDEQLADVERELGARGPERIRAFFFRDSGQKKRLMGAADTLIAKPWRKEVYVQLAGYPHPVLGHELAHAVAGSFGRGPFRVAGALFGLWPNPGLIEGVAVAASPPDDELTDQEWAHAMLEMGILPPMRTVFGAGFFGAGAAKSYTLAGAFVRFVMDRYGKAQVRAWYGGEPIERATGKGWTDLDREFRDYVQSATIAPEALALAKARFERPGVFARKCPHEIDALRGQADRCRTDHDVPGAVRDYGRVLALDPHDVWAAYGLGITNLRYGDAAAGERSLEALALGDDIPRTARDRAADALADAKLTRGDVAGARSEYERLATSSFEEDFARNEDFKARALATPDGTEVVLALFAGPPGKPPDSTWGYELAGEWRRGGSALASYLAGRALISHGLYAEAEAYFDPLPVDGTLGVRIEREVLRHQAIIGCALGDEARVDRVRGLVQAEGGPFRASAARRQATLRFLDRCTTSR